MKNDTGHRLVLEIEVPEFYVDGTTQEAADEWYDGDILPIVTEEWMREDVGLTFVSIPGEKEQNHDFEVHALVGHIVGARITKDATGRSTVLSAEELDERLRRTQRS